MIFDVSARLFARIEATFVELSTWNSVGGPAPTWILGAAVLAGIVLATGTLWRRLRMGVTFFHELGHAVAGLVAGARIRRINLRMDTSGVTHYVLRSDAGRLRSAWIAWWGYPFPGLVAGSGMAALLLGWGRTWSAGILVVVAVVLVLWVRNIWGIVLCALSVAAGGVVVWEGAAAGEVFAALLVSFLACGAVRTVSELRRTGSDPASDPVVVARTLHLPVSLVRGTMLAASVALPLALGLAPLIY